DGAEVGGTTRSQITLDEAQWGKRRAHGSKDEPPGNESNGGRWQYTIDSQLARKFLSRLACLGDHDADPATGPRRRISGAVPLHGRNPHRITPIDRIKKLQRLILRKRQVQPKNRGARDQTAVRRRHLVKDAVETGSTENGEC